MKFKLIIEVDNIEVKPFYKWVELPIIPQQGSYILMFDILSNEEYDSIWLNSKDWNTEQGLITKVVLRRDDDLEEGDETISWMHELYILCED